MAENKTRPTESSVEDFLNQVADERKRQDSFTILALMQEITNLPPVMWGPSIVGFGSYHYKYASGRQGDMPYVGFSPRKQDLTLYISSGFDGYAELLQKLGKHKTSKACLYIKRLSDIDLPTLRELIQRSVEYIANKP